MDISLYALKSFSSRSLILEDYFETSTQAWTTLLMSEIEYHAHFAGFTVHLCGVMAWEMMDEPITLADRIEVYLASGLICPKFDLPRRAINMATISTPETSQVLKRKFSDHSSIKVSYRRDSVEIKASESSGLFAWLLAKYPDTRFAEEFILLSSWAPWLQRIRNGVVLRYRTAAMTPVLTRLSVPLVGSIVAMFSINMWRSLPLPSRILMRDFVSSNFAGGI